jgi:hypothetical protein
VGLDWLCVCVAFSLEGLGHIDYNICSRVIRTLLLMVDVQRLWSIAQDDGVMISGWFMSQWSGIASSVCQRAMDSEPHVGE